MSRIAEVLAALRDERQTLLAEVSRIDRAIEARQDAAGTGPITTGTKPITTSAGTYPADPYGRALGPYSMCSPCEAAMAYLEEVGEPKTSREIAMALLAGGIRTTSKRFADTLHKALRQNGSYYGIRQTSNGKRWFYKA